MCGGTADTSIIRGVVRGLSPRVRGNHAGPLDEQRRERSIPACAGEPVTSGSGRRIARVYPRVCGGTMLTGRLDPHSKGLSPRVRGNRPQAHPHSKWIRSIPACAGEPTTRSPTPCSEWVYPRVCGGTVHRRRVAAHVSGLSPRVRGNR